jgi:hypothetical protein
MFTHPGTSILARSYAIKAICFISLLSASTVTFSGQIFKWTDKKGEVHYGDEIPEQYKNKDENIKTDGMSVINHDKNLNTAPTNAATESHKPEDKGKTTDKQHRIVLNHTQTKVKSKMTCSAQWAAYNSSLACFNGCSTYTAYHGKNISKCHCVEVLRPSCEM